MERPVPKPRRRTKTQDDTRNGHSFHNTDNENIQTFSQSQLKASPRFQRKTEDPIYNETGLILISLRI